jgi:hypothetical protein
MKQQLFILALVGFVTLAGIVTGVPQAGNANAFQSVSSLCGDATTGCDARTRCPKNTTCFKGQCVPTTADPCSLPVLTSQTISDISENIEPSSDVLSVTLSQRGDSLIMDMTLAASPLPYDGCYKLLIDGDQNGETGDQRPPLGVEYFIALCGDGSSWHFHIDGTTRQEAARSYTLGQNNLRFIIAADLISTKSFSWSFEAFNSLGNDLSNAQQAFTLKPYKPPLTIEAQSMITQPAVIPVPYLGKTTLVPIFTQNGKRTILKPDDVAFIVTHPVTGMISDPSSIIRVSTAGVAEYQSPGFVLVTPALKRCPEVTGPPVILATGRIYGGKNDYVVAVFPPEYTPPGSVSSLGGMLATYPDMLRFLDKAYKRERALYRSYEPYVPNRQVLALLEVPGHCGGNNNPLETAACCYMNCGDGTPQYNIIIHEMGHNFAMARGMKQLLEANQGRIGDQAGFAEGAASLPVQYIAHDTTEHPRKYGVTQHDFAYEYEKTFLDNDIPANQLTFDNFERLIGEGELQGIFDLESLPKEVRDANRLDTVSVVCSFFVTAAVSPENPYGWEFYPRFLAIFENKELPDFLEEKVETYFGAAYSAALARDMRAKLRLWGFFIDDTYFDEIYPLLSVKADAATLNEQRDIEGSH